MGFVFIISSLVILYRDDYMFGDLNTRYLRIPWDTTPRHVLFGSGRLEVTTLPRNEASYPRITKL